MNEQLAQCPYCFGHNPELSTNLISFQVICKTCFATGPQKKTRKEAKFAWNQLSEEVHQARLKNASKFIRRLHEVENAVLLHR